MMIKKHYLNFILVTILWKIFKMKHIGKLHKEFTVLLVIKFY